METYFLYAMQTRPSLFGTPIIVSTSPTMINSDLYASVWHQVARLMAPTTDNHAHDGLAPPPLSSHHHVTLNHKPP